MRACRHKAPPDHKADTAAGALWICSQCGKREPWGPKWGYFGSLECKKCGWPVMDWVACSAACARVLGESVTEQVDRLEQENERLKARVKELERNG